MSEEQQSRARELELHGLRLDLKRRIAGSSPGTVEHHALVRQLEALDADADAAQDRWLGDLKQRFPM